MAELFERKNGRSQKDEEDERMIASLERKVGQLTIERDWLEKKSKELGIDWCANPSLTRVIPRSASGAKQSCYELIAIVYS